MYYIIFSQFSFLCRMKSLEDDAMRAKAVINRVKSIPTPPAQSGHKPSAMERLYPNAHHTAESKDF